MWHNELINAPVRWVESHNKSRRLAEATGPAQQLRALYLYYLHDFVNSIDLKEYGDFYGFDLNFDDTEIHRKYNIFRGNTTERKQQFNHYPTMNVWYLKMFRSEETMKYGLFYEMMRYLFGTFPEIYHFHQLISDPRDTLKMEVWINNFNRNLNVVLDRLNLIDSAENRAILEQSGLSDVDIKAERAVLYQKIKTQDTSNVKVIDNGIDHDLKQNSRHGKRGSKIQAGHIHIGRNNTIYVDALLTLDPQICLVLKHITNLIDYGWSYPEYC